MAHYDLVVIGSGPAGEKGAAQAAYFGKKVAMVEKQSPRLGGACTNTGTLPSKTLRESALALTGMASRGMEAAVLALPRLGLWLRLGDAPIKCTVDTQTRVGTVTTEKGVVETAAAVLAAAGRSGNTSGMGLAELGIAPDKRGNLAVNEHFQTALPHI